MWPTSQSASLKCLRERYDTINMRCYFNVRSKAEISRLNLPHGTKNLNGGKKKKLKRKTDRNLCSEVLVNSPRNPWSQSWRRRKGRLRWEEYAEKEGFSVEWKSEGVTDDEPQSVVHSTWTELNWTELDKSTQLHDAIIGRTCNWFGALIGLFCYEYMVSRLSTSSSSFFICQIIQQYAHLREYDSRRAGEQGPIRTLVRLVTFRKECK